MFKYASNTRPRMVARANPEYIVHAAIAFDTLEIYANFSKRAPRHKARREMRWRCSCKSDPVRVVREWTYCERGH